MHFPKISSETLHWNNLIFGQRRTLGFDWLGIGWVATLARCEAVRDGLSSIHARWGGGKIVVRSGRDWVDTMAQFVLGDTIVAGLPDKVRDALLETVFADVCARVEKLSGRPVGIANSQDGDFAAPELHRFSWRLTDAGRELDGEIILDAVALEYFARVLCLADEKDTGAARWDGLPVPLRLELGWTDLPRSALSGLALQDVVLLDECWLQEELRLGVSLGGTLRFFGTLDNTTLTVTEGIAEIMDDAQEVAQASAENLNRMNVRLTFDLGERPMNLGQLKSIAPGYIFDLGRDLKRTVTIRANNWVIGEGELVEVEGRIGVSILSLSAV